MAMDYSEKVMDHFSNPRNVGEIEGASGCGTVGNAVCGDIMRMYLDIDGDGVIRDAKFKTFGCGAAIATSSMATELVIGKTVQEALQVTNKAVMNALDGLPPVKVHCSLLAEEAIHAALWDWAEKHDMVIEGLEKPKDDIHEHDHGVEEEEAEGEIAEVACTCASERGEACPRHQVSCNQSKGLTQMEQGSGSDARGRVRAVCISKRKGGRKTPQAEGVQVIAHQGVEHDAHAGDWHRQVSLLAWESICKARESGLDVAEGAFAENVTTEGIDLLSLPLGTRLRVGEVELELSQIGKVCHTKCAIYALAGDCIFPREGVFFVALTGGSIVPGDEVSVVSLGNGTCTYTPPEALEELAAAQASGEA